MDMHQSLTPFAIVWEEGNRLFFQKNLALIHFRLAVVLFFVTNSSGSSGLNITFILVFVLFHLILGIKTLLMFKFSLMSAGFFRALGRFLRLKCLLVAEAPFQRSQLPVLIPSYFLFSFILDPFGI